MIKIVAIFYVLLVGENAKGFKITILIKEVYLFNRKTLRIVIYHRVEGQIAFFYN